MYYYTIRHETSFYYSEPISESMMELQMQPRNDYHQRCARFQVVVSPRASVNTLTDYRGNTVAVFDVPLPHHRLMITCESLVEISPFPALPETLPMEEWALIENARLDVERFDMLSSSHFTRPTEALKAFIQELALPTGLDPLTLIRLLNARLYESFDYRQNTTTVDSTIDDLLTHREGVCQDFAHLMIATIRGFGIPCRYVSGYLSHRAQFEARSAADASHAWVEVWFPSLGWVGFDPTNNVSCAERHIRVAVGRDYADVPPTKGVFRGEADTMLEVAVSVEELSQLPLIEERLQSPVDWSIESQQLQTDQQEQQQQ